MTWDEFNKQEMDRRAQAQQSMYHVNLRADDTAYNRDQDALRQQVAAKARDDALSHQDAVMQQQQQFHADQQKNQADAGEEHKAAQKQQLDEFTARQAQQQQYNLERAQALAEHQMNVAIDEAGKRAAAPHLRDAELISKSGLSDTDAVNTASAAALDRAQAARDEAARGVYTRLGKPVPDWLQPKGAIATTTTAQEPDTNFPGTDLPVAGRTQSTTDYPVDGTVAPGTPAPPSAGDILSRARAERDAFTSRNDAQRETDRQTRLDQNQQRIDKASQEKIKQTERQKSTEFAWQNLQDSIKPNLTTPEDIATARYTLQNKQTHMTKQLPIGYDDPASPDFNPVTKAEVDRIAAVEDARAQKSAAQIAAIKKDNPLYAAQPYVPKDPEELWLKHVNAEHDKTLSHVDAADLHQRINRTLDGLRQEEQKAQRANAPVSGTDGMPVSAPDANQMPRRVQPRAPATGTATTPTAAPPLVKAKTAEEAASLALQAAKAAGKSKEAAIADMKAARAAFGKE